MGTHTVLREVSDTFVELWCRHVCQGLSKDMARLSYSVLLRSMATPPSALRCCLAFFEWCLTVLGFQFLLSPMGVLEASWSIKSLLSWPYALNFKSASIELHSKKQTFVTQRRGLFLRDETQRQVWGLWLCIGNGQCLAGGLAWLSKSGAAFRRFRVALG